MANNAAPKVISRVPHNNGNTPYELGSNRGTQEVPKKKSAGAIDWKNPMDSLAKMKIITAVVTTDIVAQKHNDDSITRSPQRIFFLVMSILRTCCISALFTNPIFKA
jgi:hypothetical protein